MQFRRGEITRPEVRVTQHPVRIGMIRIQFHSTCETLCGGHRIIQLELHDTELAESGHVTRILLNHELEEFTGRKQPAG